MLPPGTRPEKVIDKMNLQGKGDIRTANQYLSVLTRLGIDHLTYIVGFGGTSRYVGAKVASNLVVFENIHYGNAIYVIRRNWKTLSKMSRTELLTGHSQVIDRVIHSGSNWELKLKNIVKARLRDIGIRGDERGKGME